jgi:hypothetical protein
MKRIPCNACRDIWGPDKARCPECRGVGFFEIDDVCRRKGIDWFDNCPISYDPMCGGWECPVCGGSGPWPSKEKIDKLRANAQAQ